MQLHNLQSSTLQLLLLFREKLQPKELLQSGHSFLSLHPQILFDLNKKIITTNQIKYFDLWIVSHINSNNNSTCSPCNILYKDSFSFSYNISQNYMMIFFIIFLYILKTENLKTISPKILS